MFSLLVIVVLVNIVVAQRVFDGRGLAPMSLVQLQDHRDRVNAERRALIGYENGIDFRKAIMEEKGPIDKISPPVSKLKTRFERQANYELLNQVEKSGKINITNDNFISMQELQDRLRNQ